MELPGEPGTERQVMELVQVRAGSARRLGRLTPAGAEAMMNALAQGNHFRLALAVVVQVCASQAALAVQITSQVGARRTRAQLCPIWKPDSLATGRPATGDGF